MNRDRSIEGRVMRLEDATPGGGSGLNELTGDITAGPGTGAQAATLVLSRRHEWTAAQNVAQASLVDAATITPNGALSNNFYLLCTNAIGGTRTIAKPTSLNPGDIVNFQIKQPSSGGACLVVFDAASFFWGLGGLAPQPVASAVNGASEFYSFTVQADGTLHGAMLGQAALSGPGYQASSATSLVTGTGSKSFTTQTALAYTAGARVRATSVATGDYMEGLVTSYSGVTLVVAMDRNSGTGTRTDWNINLAGDVGGSGPTSLGVNAQTGTSYTVASTDLAKDVTYSNASAVAVALPQAGSAGFASGWNSLQRNVGNGVVTITPTTSTIEGAATLVLRRGDWAFITSDGTNYTAAVHRRASRGVAVLTDAATVAIDASLADDFRLVATGGVGATRALGNPSNMVDGQKLNVRWVQDATGGRALTFGAKWKQLGTAPTPITLPNTITLISGQYDATDDTIVFALQYSA